MDSVGIRILYIAQDLSGAVSGIRGKQTTPAVASERSIFSETHDYNTYIKSFPCRGEHVRTYISGYRCTQWQKTTNRHTHTHTHTHTRGTAMSLDACVPENTIRNIARGVGMN